MEAYTDFAEVYDTFMGDVPYEAMGQYFLASLIEAYGVSRPVREPGEVRELEEAPESGYIQGFEEALESREVQEFEEVQEEPGVTEEDALIPGTESGTGSGVWHRQRSRSFCVGGRL